MLRFACILQKKEEKKGDCSDKSLIENTWNDSYNCMCEEFCVGILR